MLIRITWAALCVASLVVALSIGLTYATGDVLMAPSGIDSSPAFAGAVLGILSAIGPRLALLATGRTAEARSSIWPRLAGPTLTTASGGFIVWAFGRQQIENSWLLAHVGGGDPAATTWSQHLSTWGWCLALLGAALAALAIIYSVSARFGGHDSDATIGGTRSGGG